MSYTTMQWMLLFFAYCVLGWVWESCYVSVRQHAWVNRGFLYGPWLPIYGFGAIIILFLTLPVREHLLLVYLFGMAGSTILEYITGAAMEKLFHMRYWDYSQHRFNLNGHICLSVSLAWGVFSILLVSFLHPPVEKLILLIPAWLAEPLSLVLVALFTLDTTKSVQAALDLKALLNKLTESSQTLEHISGRLTAAVEQLGESSGQLRQRLAGLEEAVSTRLAQTTQSKEPQEHQEFLLSQLEKGREKKSARLSALLQKAELGLEDISRQLPLAGSAAEQDRLEKIKETLLGFKSTLHSAELEMAARKDRDFQRAVSILRRNPTAASQKHHEAVSMLKKLRREHK